MEGTSTQSRTVLAIKKVVRIPFSNLLKLSRNRRATVAAIGINSEWAVTAENDGNVLGLFLQYKPHLDQLEHQIRQLGTKNVSEVVRDVSYRQDGTRMELKVRQTENKDPVPAKPDICDLLQAGKDLFTTMETLSTDLDISMRLACSFDSLEKKVLLSLDSYLRATLEQDDYFDIKTTQDGRIYVFDKLSKVKVYHGINELAKYDFNMADSASRSIYSRICASLKRVLLEFIAFSRTYRAVEDEANERTRSAITLVDRLVDCFVDGDGVWMQDQDEVREIFLSVKDDVLARIAELVETDCHSAPTDCNSIPTDCHLPLTDYLPTTAECHQTPTVPEPLLLEPSNEVCIRYHFCLRNNSHTIKYKKQSTGVVRLVAMQSDGIEHFIYLDELQSRFLSFDECLILQIGIELFE